LTAARKRVLERLATRVARHHVKLGAARADLAVAARAAHAEGASVRAIAEAVGLSRPRVHELLSDKFAPQ
jgi:DNA-binding transcriptional regulator LsrR (DeoR family)